MADFKTSVTPEVVRVRIIRDSGDIPIVFEYSKENRLIIQQFFGIHSEFCALEEYDTDELAKIKEIIDEFLTNHNLDKYKQFTRKESGGVE